jgi:hypothetical protein
VEWLFCSTCFFFTISVQNIKVSLMLPVYSSGCEILFVPLREGHRLKVFEKEENICTRVTGDWRRLHHGEPCHFYPPPCMGGKLRGLRWSGPAAFMAETRNAYEISVENLKGRDNFWRPIRRGKDNNTILFHK